MIILIMMDSEVERRQWCITSHMIECEFFVCFDFFVLKYIKEMKIHIGFVWITNKRSLSLLARVTVI